MGLNRGWRFEIVVWSEREVRFAEVWVLMNA
jgi:hypothetical protein